MRIHRGTFLDQLCKAAIVLLFVYQFSIGNRELTAADSLSTAADEIDSIVENALPFLEKEGEFWMKRQGCVSCHQIPFMLWSFQAAADRGLSVDPAKLAEWQKWSTQAVNFVKPPQKKDLVVEETLSGNIDTIAQLMLAVPDGEGTDGWRALMSQTLLEDQAEDGSWKACGQLPMQKRPEAETESVTTMWVYYSLQQAGLTPEKAEDALRVADRLDSVNSIEWWAIRLLLAETVGEHTTQFSKKLTEFQNEDGGWSWIIGEESDAIATGMVLYALGKTGFSDTDVIAKGIEFLKSSQKPSGEWAVPGTKRAAKGRITKTATYWGTAWAVIGLVEVAPERS